MNKWLKVIGAFTVFLVVLFALVEYQSTKTYENSLMSNYRYDISITANSSLENVTLYLPIPVFANESAVGMVGGDYYNKPSDWNLSPEDTRHGLMLKIETTEIKPVYHSLPIPTPEPEWPESELPEEEGQFAESPEYSKETPVLVPVDFGTSLKADHIINTRSPEGTEPLLLPKYKLRVSEKGPPVPPSEHTNPEYFEYESRVYAQYDSSPEAEVQILVSLSGSNEWWIYGCAYNEYSDRITTRLIGPQDGWSTADGYFSTGEGVYR